MDSSFETKRNIEPARGCRTSGFTRDSGGVGLEIRIYPFVPVIRGGLYHTEKSTLRQMTLLAVALMALAGCNSSSTEPSTGTTKHAAMADIDIAVTTFGRILKKHGNDVDPSQIPKPEQTVMLVFHSHGILGNGGFQYLFEGNLPGYPEFLLTRQAYRTIGATNASAAFDKAFAVFPNSTPPADIDRRLEMWQSKYNLRDSLTDDRSPDSMYLSAMDGVMQKLIDYINTNAAEFSSLPD